ncbi:T-cell surface protein tactile isoform X3 [Struthio camelus]|uniref:T-cell surface protein tactile isoform X3 n=1 Tax=Struthio camelus TaxID=8801 RepID=UPI003603F54E
MERRGLFSLFYLLAMSSVAGQLEDVITQAKVVRALPGTDVTLVCSFPRSDHIYVTQVQWSRIDDNQLTRIAVYHPTYGIQYFKFPETAYNFSVSFSIGNCCSSDAKEASCSPGPNTFPECSQWALQLKNVSVSLSGQYECSLATYPFGTKAGKIQLIVQAEAYPEISASLQEGSAGTLQKPNISCVVRKAFPKPSLVWYVDREILRDQSGEMSVKQEDSQDSEGFYQLRSTLMLHGIHQAHKIFLCACLFSFLRNETWNVSSEEIFFSFDNKSNEVSIQAFSTVASEENRSVSLAPLDFTSRASLAPATATQGSGKNVKARPFPWPTAVAVLLLLCSFLIVLGIWKWCQYQKEIMNRPPSFKPPPPPIKYTSMVESDGTPPSCHELESL